MQQLIRKQLLDLCWDADDLDWAAKFWLRLFEAAGPDQGVSPKPVHGLELRFRGFARKDLEEVRDALAQLLADEPDAGDARAGDFDPAQIAELDADGLSVSSRLFAGEEAPPLGLGLPRLAGPPFDGLYAEVHLLASSAEVTKEGRPKVHGTLVLVGELCDGMLHVKGMWRAGPPEWEDDGGRYGGWSDEAAWLAALTSFRESGQVPKSLDKKLFIPRFAEKLGWLVVRMAYAPLGRPRFWQVVLRGLLLPAFIAAAAYAISYSIENQRWSWLLRLVVPTLCAIWALCGFVFLETGHLFYWYSRFRQTFARIYEDALRAVPLTPAESKTRLDNPWARKYTAELEGAGFAKAGDYRLEPEVFGDTAVRVFYAADGFTYLYISFALTSESHRERAVCIWPAQVCWFAHTFFTDSAWVSSSSDRLGSFRKKRTGPEHINRVFHGDEDPIAFARRHQESADSFAREIGRTPLPQMPFDRCLQRNNALNDLERELYLDHPYTWGDHLHWYFQWPRWQYRS